MLATCGKHQPPKPKHESDVKSAPAIVGRWCYQPSTVPATWVVLEIRRSGNGYVLNDSSTDGSKRTKPLGFVGDTYSEIGSDTGDKYRIDRSNGELQVLDNEGLIGTATRLSDEVQLDECQNS